MSESVQEKVTACYVLSVYRCWSKLVRKIVSIGQYSVVISGCSKFLANNRGFFLNEYYYIINNISTAYVVLYRVLYNISFEYGKNRKLIMGAFDNGRKRFRPGTS